MPRKSRKPAPKKPSPTKPDAAIREYRHDTKRKNIPPAGLAAQGVVRETPKLQFAYDPHLPPVLRFDPTAAPDQLPELLEVARTRALTVEEVRTLAEALRQQEPWLEWAGKREQKGFEVEPVALHIHERIAARQDVQRDMFADPQLEYRKAIQFYQHDVDWANRMILGDSLQVMASLARREDLAGKVQMIYMDPPYGIRFVSNFQPEIGKRDVKDKATDLTREPEMVKAYRDTWTLGVHSYLAYMRDCLILSRELLSDTGSVFVQISDENLHRMRCVMDGVFGNDNFVASIVFVKTTGATPELIATTTDYVLWYAKDRGACRFRQVYHQKFLGGEGASKYDRVELHSGFRRALTAEEREDGSVGNVYRQGDMTSQSYGREKGEGASCWFPVMVNGIEFRPSVQRRWTTNEQGMTRLLQAERVEQTGKTLSYVRFLDDFAAFPQTNLWDDIGGIQSRSDPKVYVVQTATEVVKPCVLMTTDPGDLVLDPTCGSGTTAYVAEHEGRRWITADTSRVALAIARQRLLTSRFDYYKLRGVNSDDLRRNPDGPWLRDHAGILNGPCTFECKTVPEATVWISGLDRINGACGVQVCVDLSATPFYIQGSGYIEGSPLPWLVSDFGLVDAIESGIVKIPRLPVSDNTGHPEPKYFALWKHITEGLQSGEKLPGGKPKPEVVWREPEDALITLASQWKERFEYIQNAAAGQERTPPVMIIVCDNTDIAELFYRNISGEETVEAVHDTDDDETGVSSRKKKKAKTKTVYGTGRLFPELFSNREGFRPTLRIDSKLLAEAESEDPNTNRQDAAEALREIVATVGKPGKAGEQVRCVVSVQMLTEGWDANNVTHILGVRAFGSQLLCEQVVGRGLRRMDYTPDPESGLLSAEYVDVYGIPFSIIPFKGRESSKPAPEDKPKNHVHAPLDDGEANRTKKSGVNVRHPDRGATLRYQRLRGRSGQRQASGGGAVGRGGEQLGARRSMGLPCLPRPADVGA